MDCSAPEPTFQRRNSLSEVLFDSLIEKNKIPSGRDVSSEEAHKFIGYPSVRRVPSFGDRTSLYPRGHHSPLTNSPYTSHASSPRLVSPRDSAQPKGTFEALPNLQTLMGEAHRFGSPRYTDIPLASLNLDDSDSSYRSQYRPEQDAPMLSPTNTERESGPSGGKFSSISSPESHRVPYGRREHELLRLKPHATPFFEDPYRDHFGRSSFNPSPSFFQSPSTSSSSFDPPHVFPEFLPLSMTSKDGPSSTPLELPAFLPGSHLYSQNR